jgi:hypothetical protein
MMKKNENGFNGFSAIDARILLKPSETTAPLPLIIGSYPDQYGEHTSTDSASNNKCSSSGPIKITCRNERVWKFKKGSLNLGWQRFF